MRTIHRWHGLLSELMQGSNQEVPPLVEGGTVVLVDVILGGKATAVVDMELLLGRPEHGTSF